VNTKNEKELNTFVHIDDNILLCVNINVILF